ncbi:MerR family transcriptional regulator [Actibacterium sp.]|uniref:MerR family transcriptional regulator n=1 Tax=Actibacterium sp. TaxID=1872125 RepID=UPI003563024C
MDKKSPDALRTISEVSEWLETPAHVLRFWESRFSQIKPVKRAGGRRYYRPNDMLLLGGLKKLLHEDGLTIRGAQKILRDQGIKHVAGLSQPLDDSGATASVAPAPEIDEAPMMQDAPQTPESAKVVQLTPKRPKPASEAPSRDLFDLQPALPLDLDAPDDEPLAEVAETPAAAAAPLGADLPASDPLDNEPPLGKPLVSRLYRADVQAALRNAPAAPLRDVVARLTALSDRMNGSA